jgi:hypothetical protein
LARLAEVIKGEVLNFKPETTTDITVAGALAKRLFGPGVEADDKDEGHADVVVFSLGGRVFVSCVHARFVTYHLTPATYHLAPAGESSRFFVLSSWLFGSRKRQCWCS